MEKIKRGELDIWLIEPVDGGHAYIGIALGGKLPRLDAQKIKRASTLLVMWGPIIATSLLLLTFIGMAGYRGATRIQPTLAPLGVVSMPTRTPRPTFTLSPSATPLPIITPTDSPTPAPTATPIPLPSDTPTAEPTPDLRTRTARAMNLRACPSTNCRIIGALPEGAELAKGTPLGISGILPDGTWFELAGGAWVLAGGILFPPAVGLVAAPSLPTEAPTASAEPTTHPTFPAP